MKVLAVDTSSAVAAVAVMDEEKGLLGEYLQNNGRTHSQRLMLMVDTLLKGLEIKLEDIDAFAASIGPGSFTGLRIGITSIKAMAYPHNKPVVSIPTLDALAYNMLCFKGLVCPMMDARNRQVYTAVYENTSHGQIKITDYCGIRIEELVQIIKEKATPAVFLGDAVDLYREYLKEELVGNCFFAPASQMLQRASSVAGLALEKALKGQTESSFDMVPFYLRKSQAEQLYEKRVRSEQNDKS